MKSRLAISMTALCLCIATQASANTGNLVINGGFENGLTGWTVRSATLVAGGHTSSYSVRGHCRPVILQCFNGNSYANVGQVLSTEPGETYTLSFWVHSGSSAAIAEVAVRWDSILLADHLLFSSGEYALFEFTGLTASSAATPFQIYLGNHNTWQYTQIDDISVYGVTPQVPEPGTAGMLLAGLGILGYVGRRRLNRSQPAST